MDGWYIDLKIMSGEVHKPTSESGLSSTRRRCSTVAVRSLQVSFPVTMIRAILFAEERSW